MNLKIKNEEIQKITANLVSMIPEPELNRVLNQKYCDIYPGFMGFVHIYKNLSEIIPKHFTIVDLGCAYAPQAYYFTEHTKYIGVDMFDGERFSTENTEHHIQEIADFCESMNLELETTFAICSYVPPWGKGSIEVVRKYFKNMFTFYPAGGERPKIKR